MSKNKRYYWLKLKEDFFEDDTIAWLKEQENGKDYIIFYLTLCLKSLKDNGQLIRYVGERLIPYDVKALAKLTDTPPDTVAVAMKVFLDIGLIEHLDTGEIYMTQINEMIGSETDSARRMRKKRLLDNKKQELLEGASHCAHNVQKSDTEIDIEIDTEKDKELQLEKKQNQAAVADFEINKVNNFFQNNFSNLNQHIKEDLRGWIKEIGSDLVLEAMKRAVEAEKNYNYAKGIMKSWKQNRVKTLNDVEKEDKAFANRRKSSHDQKNKINKETLPEWARSDYKPSEEEGNINRESINERLSRLNEYKKERGIIQ